MGGNIKTHSASNTRNIKPIGFQSTNKSVLLFPSKSYTQTKICAVVFTRVPDAGGGLLMHFLILVFCVFVLLIVLLWSD